MGLILQQGDCQEVMAETSRQLDRIVAKDWDHQVELNQRRQEEDKLQDQVDAFRIKQVVEPRKLLLLDISSKISSNYSILSSITLAST